MSGAPRGVEEGEDPPGHRGCCSQIPEVTSRLNTRLGFPVLHLARSGDLSFVRWKVMKRSEDLAW